MTDKPTAKPPVPDFAQESTPPDVTVDLTLDGDDVTDLQAFADAVAEETNQPESPRPPQGEDVSALLDTELERTLQEARERIEELEKREAEHLEKHHRLLADFANYRNRTAKEVQLAVDQSERKLLLEILPVLDNFERCLGASYQSVEDVQGGVALIQKQFQDALRRIGVESVELAVGDPFDAAHAEALTTTMDPKLPDGCVAAVFERGFLLRSQLLRAARVVVNRNEHLEAQTQTSEA